MEVTFLEGKTRHNILWNRIAEPMSGEFHARVTGKACNYKCKAEKKKWRDVNNNNKTSGRATSHNDTMNSFRQSMDKGLMRSVGSLLHVIMDTIEPRSVRPEAVLARSERQLKNSEIIEVFINT